MDFETEGHDTITGSISTDDPLSHLSNVSLDTVLDALANEYRRRLLTELLEHNPQDDMDAQLPAEVTMSNVDREQLEIHMVHTHLPKLEDMGLIEWNRETNKVQKGHVFDEVRPLLQWMQEHADELPD